MSALLTPRRPLVDLASPEEITRYGRKCARAKARPKLRVELTDAIAAIMDPLRGFHGHRMRRAAGAGCTALDVTFLQRTDNDTNQSTYTFSGVNIGAAAPDRHVLVVAAVGNLGGQPSITDVSIGGTTAAADFNNYGAGGGVGSEDTGIPAAITVGLFRRLVTSGTAATIAITLNATVANCSIYTYTVTGAESISRHHTHILAPNTPGINFSLNIPCGGVALGGTAMFRISANGGGFADTWTGLTRNSSTIRETEFASTAASDDLPNEQAGRSITISNAALDLNLHVGGVASYEAA